MSETLDLIAGRFACRAFTDQPVPHDVLRTIAEAGLHAPSAFNRQPWRLVIVDDPQTLADIGRVGLANLKVSDPASYDRILGRGGRLLYDAPAMIVIARQPQPGDFSADLDIGVVASHLTLAAASLGLNSCIAGLPIEAFRGEDGARRGREIGIPDGFEFALAVLLGHAAKQFTPHEIDLAKIIDQR